MPLKKIVIIGPESTGKSSLCAELAAHYKTGWLQEYAREYLLTNGKEYQFDDLIKIAEGQLLAEDKFITEQKSVNPDKPVFLDTDLYVMKVWSEFVFNKCDNRILSSIARREYDLYLLCDTDLPWTADELREYPDYESRKKLFHFYRDALIQQHVPWRLIRGQEEQRSVLAINLIDEWMKSIQ